MRLLSSTLALALLATACLTHPHAARADDIDAAAGVDHDGHDHGDMDSYSGGAGGMGGMGGDEYGGGMGGMGGGGYGGGGPGKDAKELHSQEGIKSFLDEDTEKAAVIGFFDPSTNEADKETFMQVASQHGSTYRFGKPLGDRKSPIPTSYPNL